MKKSPIKFTKYVVSKLKDPYWQAKCNYIKYYEELPIDDKAVLFESMNATKADGNIFYLLKYITSSPKYSDYTIYLSSWGRHMKKIQATLDFYEITNVKIVIYASDEYIRLLASAKYLINDSTFPYYYIKKEGQSYLNTWHGTPLKAMGKSFNNDVLFGNVQKNFVVSDYLLYPNVFTKDHMVQDYMLENICSNAYVLGGYPRNEVFFDDSRVELIKETLEISDKRTYAYMPTWRGSTDKIGSAKNDTYLLFYLYEIDKNLTDDEIFYVNLHPLAQKNVKFNQFKHIKSFPSGYETYDFLNVVDVLVTDYSSVFFDFACTKKKVVLFPYDKEDYLEGRGMYMTLEELPFPQVFDAKSLVDELRSPKGYDDTEFLETFCPYDNANASQQLCDYFILGEDTGLSSEKIPDNGKENVLIYAGNLAKNGITTSLRSLLETIDCDKRNYYISFCQKKARNNGYQLATFNPKVNFFAVAEYFNLTLNDKINKNLFTRNMLSAQDYMKACSKRFEQNFTRAYGNARFDKVIQFNGYESEIMLLYSTFKGRKVIFVHNDMVDEIKTKGNQRKDVLNYVYNQYDKVAVVTEDIVAPTLELKGNDDTSNITVVKNTINYKDILERSNLPIDVEDISKCSVELDRFLEVMQNGSPKYINIGRFSPEKGQERLIDAFYKVHQANPDTYLIVMGGYSVSGIYEKLVQKVIDLGLEENVILLFGVSNPYPILKACDYFVLSSFYEGFGLVLAEADILGKPVISTDINGPRVFMNKYGGTLVENSEEGILNGMNMLLEGKVKPMNVDYEAYNQTCVDEFESLLS